MSSSLINPYKDGQGIWIRGNLHGHCCEHSGCASVPLLHGAALYHAAGARFMAVTDHDHVTDLTELRALYPEMVFLEGFEYSSRENLLFIGEAVPPLYELSLEEALGRCDGLLTVVCHPRPRKHSQYWTPDMIYNLDPRPLGMEVFNGHYNHPLQLWRDTNPLYTDIWDELLSRGARLWGFANDDFHDPPDFGKAYNMACVKEISPASVLEALKAGRFYATTGLLLGSLSVDGGEIRVKLAGEAHGRFIGPGGRVLREEDGAVFSFSYRGEEYIRFEAEGKPGRIFLQPFFARW